MNQESVLTDSELSASILSEVTIFNKYAKHLEDKERRETWDEICDRYETMMIEKYPSEAPNIVVALDYVRAKKVLPSMRAMQFAGPAISKNHARIYNCAYLPVDDYRAFSEGMFLLLGGTGLGYSVQMHHVDKLPEIVKPLKEKKYLIGDSLEGWADAVKVLFKAYFGLSKYKPRFDFSDIRPKGARLVTAGGKAPGPGPLKECLVKIENILESKQTGDKLKPIECHDIICHIANSVLSGGIRRSACIALFSFDDPEMTECKYGNWWETNEQRGRSNNSAVIVRNKVSKEDFLSLWKKIELSNSGEPGIYFTDDKDWGTNPCCFTGNTSLLTEYGKLNFSEIVEEFGGELNAYNYKGELVPCKVWYTGVKKVITPILSNYGERFTCTPDHVFMLTDGTKCEAKDLVGKRIMPFVQFNKTVSEYTKYGFIQGNISLGGLASDTHKGLEIYFGEKDLDVAILFGYETTGKQYVTGYNEILDSLGFSSEPLPTRELPASFSKFSREEINHFLQGLYSANGSIVKGHRIAFKTTSKVLVHQLRSVLSDLNIYTYITINKEKDVQFKNGLYTCKESYDLNISKYSSLLIFAECINFIHQYKQDALYALIKSKAPKVLSISEDIHETDVYDFSLNDDTHWGVVAGQFIAHNCEVALRPNQFCNLTEVNVSNIKDEQDLHTRVSVAAYLGTLQAGFTDFHYLRPVWRTTTEKEALIGVGMTGIASGEVLKYNLKNTAEVAKTINKTTAEDIGINQAARTTVIKPSGTTSCVLGTSSGIHAWHNDYYIRRIRIMKNDPLYTYLVINHPELIEDDQLRSHDTAVISIPQKAPQGAIVRTESTFDLLERVKKFNLEWVRSGHRKGANTNNVSATISVKPTEWPSVGEWMWNNKHTFNGLSVLPYDNGSYIQAPFEDCTEEKYKELMKTLTSVDLSKVIELSDSTEFTQEAACAGGKCEV